MPEQSTILVVDDEIGPRESLRVILHSNYRVLVAAEGEQAIRLVEQEAVDIVLLDLRMPGLSGIQVMEKIKAIDPSIEVIVVTGYASYDTLLEGLRLHAFDYISKPFNISYLYETLKRAAAHRHLCQKQNKEEMIQQFHALTQHIGVISHDLRAALQMIDDCSQALLENYANQLAAPGKDALQHLRTAGQRVAQLINSLPVSTLTERGTP